MPPSRAQKISYGLAGAGVLFSGLAVGLWSYPFHYVGPATYSKPGLISFLMVDVPMGPPLALVASTFILSGLIAGIVASRRVGRRV